MRLAQSVAPAAQFMWGFPRLDKPRRTRRFVLLQAPHLERCGWPRASHQPHSSVWGFPRPDKPRRTRRFVLLQAPHLEKMRRAQDFAPAPQFSVGIPTTRQYWPDAEICALAGPRIIQDAAGLAPHQPHSSMWGTIFVSGQLQWGQSHSDRGCRVPIFSGRFGPSATFNSAATSGSANW